MVIAGYLESGILSWGVPLALLIVILAYWVLYLRRHRKGF